MEVVVLGLMILIKIHLGFMLKVEVVSTFVGFVIQQRYQWTTNQIFVFVYP
jgi:hypothetical protein